MITKTQARDLGKSDRNLGLTDEEIENVAESISENYGGQWGKDRADAYRKGAGM